MSNASWRNDVVKANVPRVDLQSYNIFLVGEPKSGKTRLYKEIIEEFYPNEPEAGILLAFEDGYTSWELDSVIDMHNRDWEFFKNVVVKGLVADAKNGTPTKVIGIDTVDRLMAMAEIYMIAKMSKKYGKQFASLQDVSETVKEENGHVALKNDVWDQFQILKKAGYGMIYTGWTKVKESTTIDDVKFDSVELSISKTGKDIFLTQAHLVCTLFNEITVIDKDGNELEENIKSKKGKEIASKFHKAEQYMYFRPTNYVAIGGGRFTDLPDKAPYGIKNFREVFENAVKGQLKKNKGTIEDLRQVETQQREERVQEYAEQEEQKANAADLITAIEAESGKLTPNEIKEHLVPTFKELLGTPNFRKVEDVEKLAQALKFTKEKVNGIKGFSE